MASAAALPDAFPLVRCRPAPALGDRLALPVPAGTLIAQNDKDIWTLQTRWPQEVAPEEVDIPALLRGFAGRDFAL